MLLVLLIWLKMMGAGSKGVRVAAADGSVAILPAGSHPNDTFVILTAQKGFDKRS